MSFKINYKGKNCRGCTFLYRCEEGHEQEETHTAAEEPTVQCKECGKDMRKKPVAPAFDADHHNSMRSENLGREGDA